jgi:hypothetical protein
MGKPGFRQMATVIERQRTDIQENCSSSVPVALRSGGANAPPEKRIGRDGKQQAAHKQPKSRPKLDIAEAGLAAIVARNEPPTRSKIMKETGCTELTAHLAMTRFEAAETVRAEAFEEQLAKAIEASLSKTAREKIDVLLRKEKKRLAAGFEAAVNEETQKRINEIGLPYWQEQIDKSKTLYLQRTELMDKTTFNMIRRALHPDSRNSITDKKLAEAFDAFMALEKYLLSEKDSPTEWPTLPRTWEDWQKMKQAATAARRAKYAAKRANGHSGNSLQV